MVKGKVVLSYDSFSATGLGSQLRELRDIFYFFSFLFFPALIAFL